MTEANQPTSPPKSLYQHIQEHENVKAGLAIAIIWDTDDLLELENPETNEPYGLTEAEAKTILADLHRNHNTDVGITWDTIEDGIKRCLRARKTTEENNS